MSFDLVQMGEVAKFINGDRGKNYPSKDSFVESGIAFINAGCLSDLNILDKSKLNYITEENYNRLSSGKIQKNDILFCLRGSLGKFAVIRDNELGALASSLVIIRANEKVDVEYLKHFLSSDLCAKEINAYENGAAQPNLSASDLKKFQIPLPPLPEQKRIAQILDKADELRQKRQQSIEKLDELLQATFIDMFGDPVTNPKGWDLVKLSTIAEYFNGLTYKPENVVNNGTIVLRSSNIQNSGLDFNDIVRVNAKIKDKIFVKDNDILMCSRNGSAKLVGKVALIKNLNEPMTFGAFMMIIRSNEKYANYLLNCFKTLAFRRQISTGATTTINQITGAMLDRISLPLPNDMALNQFTEIAKSIETQKQRLEKQLTKQENLFKSLQQRAFNGEL